MIDISIESELHSYLIEKGFLSATEEVKIKYFEGGVSGTVAMVKTSKTFFLVKQALSKLKVKANWECGLNRIKVEYLGLEAYARIVPASVPKPINFDDENFIMIREAAPENARMWKSDLLAGIFDEAVAHKVIESLSLVHNITANDEKVHEDFVDGEFFYLLRIEPYIEYVVKQYPGLKEKSTKVINMLMNEHVALVHGDFSPKNIMLCDDRIYILDFETAYFGHPAFDIAFFANHFLLKAVKNKQWSVTTLNMLSSMMEYYFRNVEFMDARVLESETIQTLGFLFLARVDGKSPAEYITLEQDKNTIRRVAQKIINEDMSSFSQVVACLKAEI